MKVIEKASEACGAKLILTFYLQRLQQAIQSAQQQPDKTSSWVQIEAILVCISGVVNVMKADEAGDMKDVILLLFQMPNQWIALKRTGATLLSRMSYIMIPLGQSV